MSTEKPLYGDIEEIRRDSGVTADDVGFVDTELELQQHIKDIVDDASRQIDDYCDRGFGKYEKVEKLHGNGRGEIQLSGYPVIDVEGVTVNGEQLADDQYRVRPSRGPGGGNAGILERRSGVFPEGWENVEVSYTWGFDEPPGAVISVVEGIAVDALLEAKRNKATGGAASMSLDGFSVNFSPGDLDEYTLEALNRYKVVALA